MYLRFTTVAHQRTIRVLRELLDVLETADQVTALEDHISSAAPKSEKTYYLSAKAKKLERAYLERLEALQEENEVLQRRLERADLWKPCPKCGTPLDRAEGDA